MKLFSRLAVAVAVMLLPTILRAQTSIEITSGNSSASGGHASYHSFGVRLRHERPPDIWYLGVSRESHFRGPDGWLGNISNTHTFNPLWTSHLSATTSSDVFFLPLYRFDAQLSRRLGARRAWVLTGMAMTRAARDEHRDFGGGLGVTRFLPGGLAADATIFLTHTTPEDIVTTRQHLGLTWYRPQREFGARVGFGKESYLPITTDSVLVDFTSYDVTARWVEPVSGSAAVAVSATYYHNPRYHSRGFGVTLIQRLTR